MEHGDQYSPYPPLPLSAQGFPPITATSTSMNGTMVSPLTRGEHSSINLFSKQCWLILQPAPLDTRAFDFPPQQQRAWGSPFDNGPISAGHSSPGDGPQSYWGRHDSPMTPGFSPHMAGGPTSSVHSASISDGRNSFTSFAPSRSDSAWGMPMPNRSMSFGMIEDLPMSYQNNFHRPQHQPVDVRRRASEMYPPSLQTSANSSTASIPDTQMTPVPAPVSSPPSNQWGIPPLWNQLPSNGIGKAPDYSAFYSEPSLAKVQEEEFAPPFGGEPAILYAGAEHQ